MGRILTNNTSLAYAIETTPGVLPGSPDWFVTEPNTVGAYGNVPTTVVRSPISKLRQQRKGTVTDLDSPVEFESDLTMSAFTDFAEGFVYSTAVNSDTVFRASDVTVVTGYTVPALDATQAGKFQFAAATGPASLFFARGYLNAVNNGVKVLATNPVATDTELDVDETTVTLVTETAPTNAELSMMGIRAEAGDLALAVASNIGTLTSGNGAPVNAIDFTTLGLTVGQRIHVGGLLTANRFGSTAGGSNDSFGGARVTSIAAGTLLLDKLDSDLTASDGTDTGSAGTEVRVDLLYGRFIRNVTVDSSEYLERTYQFEEAFPNLGTAGATNFWYSIGNRAAEMSLNNPLTDKATVNFGFVGQSSDDVTATQKTNADTPIEPVKTEAFNTAADFFRLGILDVDETGLTSDFKDMTATFNNNVSGEKVLGFLGNKFINNGNFEVSIAVTALFTNPLVPKRITDNTTVTMGWVQRNGDGALSIDIPSATLGSDGIELPVNESVRIGLTVTAFVDPVFNTSIGVSLFPAYPAS